jgi:hypothetical protein
MTYCYPPWKIPQPPWDNFLIVNVETRSVLGSATPDGSKYRVEDLDGRVLAEVNCLNDAGPALADYYEKHAKWEREKDGFFKWTKYGVLIVFQEQGLWNVGRDSDQSLRRDGDFATFHTLKEAQHAAEAYSSRAAIGPERISTGCYWFEPFQKFWYSDPIVYAKWRTVVDARRPAAPSCLITLS